MSNITTTVEEAFDLGIHKIDCTPDNGWAGFVLVTNICMCEDCRFSNTQAKSWWALSTSEYCDLVHICLNMFYFMARKERQ